MRRQIERTLLVRSQVGEYGILSPPVVIIAGSNDEFRKIAFEICLPDVHNLFRSWKWKWTQQNSIDDTEHRAIGANAQSQRKYRGKSKPRIFPKRPERELQILEYSHAEAFKRIPFVDEGKSHRLGVAQASACVISPMRS